MAQFDQKDAFAHDRRHATRAQVVADELRNAICDGQYICGERLVESTIARDMGVSQNTVRDALRLLEREAWVVYRARRGVIVPSFDVDEAEEIFALWSSIEALALRWTMERSVRVDLIGALRPAINKAREQFSAGAWAGVRSALFDFHRTLVALPKRPRTAELLTRLHNQAYLLDVDYEQHNPRPPEVYDLWVAGYERVFGIIKFGELDAAQQALEDRIMDNGKPVIRWLALHS